ncbi:hypothetical protein SS50377_20289 [Spironucleus salmonicida]|uniref:Uncharacterized protein n=1 Tax=Spironucleus salmonicida TaxID=348837 RepID=V6LM99_9EUKA|nr:hypothetical protein SS50377_20289 [Spironucleus salmonicida]|eukprot:EST45343.1 Hypothetical protein SS50377_14922 [Spironucleus salmonicida]
MEIEIRTLQDEITALLHKKFASSFPILLATTDLSDFVQTISYLRIQLNENQNKCLTYQKQTYQAIQNQKILQQQTTEADEIQIAAKQQLQLILLENADLQQEINVLNFQLKDQTSKLETIAQNLAIETEKSSSINFNSQALELIKQQEKAQTSEQSVLLNEINLLKSTVETLKIQLELNKTQVSQSVFSAKQEKENCQFELKLLELTAENEVLQVQLQQLTQIVSQNSEIIQENCELKMEISELKKGFDELENVQKIIENSQGENVLTMQKIEKLAAFETGNLQLSAEIREVRNEKLNLIQKVSKICMIQSEQIEALKSGNDNFDEVLHIIRSCNTELQQITK